MQVSIETTSGLERKMTIGVPAERIESEVTERLEKASKNVKLDGFRKGKVPLSVIKQRFGKGIRQEVIGDVVRTCFVEAVTQEKITPASQPALEPTKDVPGEDFEFVATFEVLPEIKLADFAEVKVAKPVAEVKDQDVDNMLEALRKQQAEWVDVDRAAAEGDEVTIDYVGVRDGEAFDGGSAEDFPLELGSGKAVPGFEEGIVGMSKGDEKVIAVKFPDNYHAEEMRGADVEFTIKLKEVKEAKLPEMTDDFFASYGLQEGGEEVFRSIVRQNMERDLKNALEGKTKSRVMEKLYDLHNDIEAPMAQVANELQSLKQQMAQKLGGNNDEANKFDPSMLPDDMFMDQAKRRAVVGLVVNEIVQSNEMDVDGAKVRARIEEIASTYEQSDEVVNYYYNSPELLKSIEANVLQEQVVQLVLASADVTEEEVGYEQAVTPDPEQIAAEG
jgi:trigger factor